MQAAEAELFKSKGAVVNVSSIVTLKAGDDDFAMCYTAAKAAQEKITEVLYPVCAPPFPFCNRCRLYLAAILNAYAIFSGYSLWDARLVAHLCW